MTKIIFITLSLLIAFSSSARDFSYRYKGNTLIYTVIDEDLKTCKTKPGDVTYESYGNYVSGDLIIPENAKDGEESYTVIAIGDCAFCGCKDLISILIPSSINEIGKMAFKGCESLTSINIPNSVKLMGDYAFALCKKMTSASIGDSVSSISDSAFWGCSSLESVNIPKSVTSICDYAFSNCSSLVSVTIPNSVIEIGRDAFFECSSLTSINIPNSVMAIGNYAFSYCYKLTNINVDDDNDYFCSNNGVLFNKDSTIIIQYPAGKVEKEYVIPNSVTTIGREAFCYNVNLNSIDIPDSVIEIWNAAFSNCSGLSSVIIPNSVCLIGDRAFRSCSGISSISIPNNVTSIGEGAFSDCSNLISIEIGNSLSFIGKNAFSSCVNIKILKINSLSKWGIMTFGNERSNPMYYSESFIIEENKEPPTQLNLNLVDKDCSAYAFYNAKNLETIRINAHSIESNAFYGCSNIKKICIDVEEISDYAFGDNEKMEDVYSIPQTPPVAPDNVFKNYQGIILHVPFGSASKYEDSATCWWKFKNILEDGFSNLNEIFGNDYNDSVEEISCSFDADKPYEIYNLNGVRVFGSTMNLSSGLYIIKQGNITKKVIVR